MEIEVMITGWGSPEDVVKSLRDMADEIQTAKFQRDIIKKTQRLEDMTLIATINNRYVDDTLN